MRADRARARPTVMPSRLRSAALEEPPTDEACRHRTCRTDRRPFPCAGAPAASEPAEDDQRTSNAKRPRRSLLSSGCPGNGHVRARRGPRATSCTSPGPREGTTGPRTALRRGVQRKRHDRDELVGVECGAATIAVDVGLGHDRGDVGGLDRAAVLSTRTASASSPEYSSASSRSGSPRRPPARPSGVATSPVPMAHTGSYATRASRASLGREGPAGAAVELAASAVLDDLLAGLADLQPLADAEDRCPGRGGTRPAPWRSRPRRSRRGNGGARCGRRDERAAELGGPRRRSRRYAARVVRREVLGAVAIFSLSPSTSVCTDGHPGVRRQHGHLARVEVALVEREGDFFCTTAMASRWLRFIFQLVRHEREAASGHGQSSRTAMPGGTRALEETPGTHLHRWRCGRSRTRRCPSGGRRRRSRHHRPRCATCRHRTGAGGVGSHLEHAHRAVPHDRLRVAGPSANSAPRAQPDVEPHPAVLDVVDRDVACGRRQPRTPSRRSRRPGARAPRRAPPPQWR